MPRSHLSLATLMLAQLACGSANRDPGTHEGAPPTATVARSCVAPVDSAWTSIPIGPEKPEQYSLDLDADGIADRLSLHHVVHQTDPGAYDRLDLVLSRSGAHHISGLWDPPRLRWPIADGNVVPSRAIYVRPFAKAGTLLFVFSEDVEPGQSVTIYRVTTSGVEKYFGPSLYVFTAPITMTQAGEGVMMGTSVSEGAISGHADTLGGGFYVPTLVYTLGATALLDSAASIVATRKAEGGFAGFSEPDYAIAVRMCDGTRFVLDTRTHQHIE